MEGRLYSLSFGFYLNLVGIIKVAGNTEQHIVKQLRSSKIVFYSVSYSSAPFCVTGVFTHKKQTNMIYLVYL